jgi:serine/threonine protein kinase/TolB-like protein/Tfp pilus assembly protein PilF
MPLSPGTKLGRYEIRSLLGAGGMGEVYRAQDTVMRRPVALKLLPQHFTANQDRLHRFKREAYAVSSLNHPNILTIYEIGAENELNFIATELIEGESLRQHLQRTSLELSEVLDIGMQIASALSAAHAAGIIHRDIKLENVMLRHDRLVKVLDFGLAKLIEHKSDEVDLKAPTKPMNRTEPGTVMGTTGYMSPEQARGLEVDERTDIWSLGVVLYEMVTGRLPFEGETASDVVAAILKTESPTLTRYAPNVPAELERIVAKALRKNREERYQVVKDLGLDLKSLKQRLEFETELARTGALGKSGEAQQEMIGTGGATATMPQGAVPQSAAGSVHTTTSSAEYIVGEIKRHKLAAILILATIVAALVTIAYFASSRSSVGGDQASVPAPSAELGIRSIAVLPFANATGNPDTEYLSEGISEGIINSLSQLTGMKVIARSSSFQYKGKEVNPQEVARALGVEAILTGRVAQHAGGLLISVELVNARDKTQMWGEQYNRKATDLFAVQKEISQEISEKLRLKLSGEDRLQLAKRETGDPEAYQLYLKGRFYWNRRTAENLKKAIEQFQQAVDKDPNYALAYVGLADCYLLLEEYAGTPTSETVPKAKAYAEQALQLDGSLAEAHASLGLIHDSLWQWAEAEREFKRAIELNPNYPTARHWYSRYLRNVGRFDESLAEIKRAQQLDPLSLVITGNLIYSYLATGDVNAAIEQGRKAIELDANSPIGHLYLGLAYLKQGHPEALAHLQKAVELSDRASEPLGYLGYANATVGKRPEALAIIQEIKGKYARREALGQYLALVYAGLGEKDQAFAWLEKDFQARSAQLPEIRWLSEFDSLRSDPRYADLLRRMELTP